MRLQTPDLEREDAVSHQQWYETRGMYEEWLQWRKPREVSEEWVKQVDKTIDVILEKEKENDVIQ